MTLTRRSFLSKGFLACLFAPFAAKAAISPFVGVASKDFDEVARVSEAFSRTGIASQSLSKSVQALTDHIEELAKEPPRYGYISMDWTPEETRPSEWSMKMTDGSPQPERVQRGDDRAGWYETLTHEMDAETTWHLKTRHIKADFRFVHSPYHMISNSPSHS